ncbi:MFS transporter [Nocardiopsis sediminis]|uniref:MFS transporter n=1 Tax=Nocardiopsis sediminis TaxID=1778267 RepID=A0ABV8FPJ3_9ACTN
MPKDPLSAQEEPAASDPAPLPTAPRPRPPTDGGPPPAAQADQPQEKAPASFIFWMVAANFGVSMAYIVPMTYSLAVRIDDLAPGREEVLGYVTGTAQFTYIFLSPLLGVWSDRTRTRIGRRRPFMIGGALLGLLALGGISAAPNLPLVGVSWVLAMVGWASVGQAILNTQADRIPEEQRGRISGLTGLSAQAAPIIGIGLVSTVTWSTTLVFLLPGAVGAALVAVFLVIGREADSRGMAAKAGVSVRTLVASYAFNPRAHPDFGWNWLGRFIFFMGLYFNTAFATFFYAQRLDLPVREVAGTVAVIGAVGVATAMAGAVGGGYLSDKLGRRRLFTLIGALLFVTGAVVEAFAYSFPVLMAGALLMQLAIAAFGAVDQAIVLAILPSRAEAGRYMAVNAFSQKIPSGLAPLLAPFIIAIGATGGEQNYTVLYLSGAVLALIGGLIIFTRVKSVR